MTTHYPASLPAATSLVYGELSADGAEIVVLVSGEVEDHFRAAKLLETLTPRFSRFCDERGLPVEGALKTHRSWPAVVQLSGAFGAAWRAGPRLTEWVGRELTARMAALDPDGGLRVTPPSGRTPYHWQVSGARMIAATGSAYITDSAGVGKTVTTVLGLVERAAAGHDVFPVVVVCPAQVITHWRREFTAWAPWVRSVEWAGTPAFRRKLAGHHDVYVVSYETCRRDASDDTKGRSPLVHVNPVTVVADESHRMKDSTARQTLAVQRLCRRAANVVALTGTPIAHSFLDTHTTLEAMDPAAWPSRERMQARYAITSTNDYGQDEVLGINPAMEAEFWANLEGQYRRVIKDDVLPWLPPKVYTVEYVEVPEPWRTVYDRYETEMLTELPDGGELEALEVLAQFQHLSQLAAAPGDVEVSYTTEADPETGLPVEKKHQHIVLKDDPPSWKVDKLMEVLGRYPGQPVATLAPSRQLMVLAGQRAAAAGYRVGYIVGGQGKRKRQAAIDAFQRGDLDLVCVSTKAGGVGLTLTAAGVAVFLQRPWGYIESDQAEDRFHRIGAEVHSKIDIIDVVAQRTIESRVREVLKTRAGAFSEFARDPRIVAACLGGASVTRIQPRRSA